MKFVLPLLILVVLGGSFVVSAQKRPITVYLAGDSTMATKPERARPEFGWGEFLQPWFNPAQVVVENHAQNGRSTKSFIDEGRWQAIIDKLKKGDYVFIQFGHNDQKKEDPKRFAGANELYRENLIRFVKEVRAKKANPVLLTPVMRRRFNDKGEFYDTHGDWPDAVRRVATELKVPLIDLHRSSEKIIRDHGVEESKKIFMIFPPGTYPNMPEGRDDNTHFVAYGAELMAGAVVAEIRRLKLKLAPSMKGAVKKEPK